MSDLVLGGIYQHYKGMKYRVLNLVYHSETLECLVYYECLYDNPKSSFWVRPLNMFSETVLVNGEIVPRFKYIGDQKGSQQI